MLTVLIAGIPRSGSTWLFNAARILLMSQYPSVYACWIDDFEPTEFSCDVRLIKLHSASEYWLSAGDIILCSKRDLRDIAASSVSIGWTSTVQEQVQFATEARKLHDFWAPNADLDLYFADIVEHEATAFRRVAAALRLHLSDELLDDLLGTIPRSVAADSGGEYDTCTLLHSNHVTDGRPGRWRGQIRNCVAEKIVQGNHKWMLAQGLI